MNKNILKHYRPKYNLVLQEDTMSKFKKITAYILCIAMLLCAMITLASCGDDDETDGTNSDNTGSNTQTPTPDNGGANDSNNQTPGNSGGNGGSSDADDDNGSGNGGGNTGDDAEKEPSVDENGDCVYHDWIEASCEKPKTCRVCGEISGTALGHTGGVATCSRLAKCDVCHAHYGEFNTASHKGGVATCTAPAVCQDCRQPYGGVSETLHTGTVEWIKKSGTHYSRYTCCGKCSEPESHTIIEGVCSVCGHDPQLPTESKEATQGDKNVTIAISIKDNPGILGLQIKIEFDDTSLHLSNVSAGSAMEGFTFTAPSQFKSGMSVMFDRIEITEADIRDGEMLILTFDIDDNAPTVDFEISFSVIAYDNNTQPIDFKMSSSTISVSEKN